MIEFHLSSRSGVSPYLQLVQQVRQAMRLGLMREGDQLPTVKDVVGRLAINPNTVLKAYRELEREGLVTARPGVGTFVTGTLSDGSLAAHEPLRQELQAWLAKARDAGLDDESVEALFASTFRGQHGGRPMSPVSAIEAVGLGKRYGRRWALEGCTLTVPAGRIVALVGPNGAGKSTLLGLATGLISPSAGSVTVLGRRPGANAEQLARVGFVAQETPVYAGLSVADHLKLGAKLNPRWDAGMAEARIARLQLDPAQKAGKLSGGQRAQLALTLAAAKRPELLLLDEPVAALDPLARRAFLQNLMDLVAELELTVVLSSHLLADLERVCDHLVLLEAAHVQLAGDVDQLLATHVRLVGARGEFDHLPEGLRVVHASHTERQSTVIARVPGARPHPYAEAERLDLEELVLAYMSRAAEESVVGRAPVKDLEVQR